MAADKKRIGRQTPTKSYVLEYQRSKYQEAISYYEKSGQSVLEWQRSLLRDIMAINTEHEWTHMTIGYSVPRRNGKTEAVYMRELWGLFKGEHIIHTAHRTSTSHSSWEKVKRLLEKSGLVEGTDFRSIKAKGSESLEIFETEGVIHYRTRTGSGGLGEGFDLLVVDEAQEYTGDQQSALRYTISSSMNPQIIMCGTPPTAVSKGTIFPKYRETCLSGNPEDSMWAEWSIEKMAEDRSDLDLWYETNPSLGLIINERSVRGELSDTEETDFNIQRLGLWIQYNQSSAICAADWDALTIDRDNMPAFKGRLFAGIKYGKDNKNVALSIAVKTTDQRIYIESLDCREIAKGNPWLIDFLLNADVEKIVIDGANGQSLLTEEMKDSGIKKKPILPKVAEIIEANSAFTQGIASKSICHSGQPSLRQVATNCDKRSIGTNGGFGYKSQIDEFDIALLDSAILAYWACATTKETRKQRICY